MKSLYIAVDFDGTCVTHEYPEVGKDICAVPVLKKLVAAGHKIILFTMRSGAKLSEAVEWFRQHDIPLFGINENPTQKNWTESPKVYAHIYIDDTALGCPLAQESDVDRPFVDWAIVEQMLLRKGVLHTEAETAAESP